MFCFSYHYLLKHQRSQLAVQNYKSVTSIDHQKLIQCFLIGKIIHQQCFGDLLLNDLKPSDIPFRRLFMVILKKYNW